MKGYIRPFISVLFLLILTVLVLKISGRSWFAIDGSIFFWYGESNGSGTSQHFLDPYSFTHFLHGVIFFWLIHFSAARISFSWKFVLAVGMESLWEIVENSPVVINRYRAVTIALGYFGDSILNSMSDILVCSIGFIVASKLDLRKSLILVALVETFLLIWIKDSLLINIIMLIYPIEAIKAWQMQ
ncbi:MAG: DUF2585 family protein [Candidatus Rifleibacteriota bacterium]